MFKRKKKTGTIAINNVLEKMVSDLSDRVLNLENKSVSIENKFELIKSTGKIFELEYETRVSGFEIMDIKIFNKVRVEEEKSEDSYKISFELFLTKYVLTLEKVDYEKKNLYKITKVEEK